MNDHMKIAVPDDDTRVQAFQILFLYVITSKPVNHHSTVQFHEDVAILKPCHHPGLVLGKAVTTAAPV